VVRGLLIFSTVLLTQTHGPVRVLSFAVYAVSVGGLFGVSAVYHCGTWSEAWRQRLQRLDHVMIFLLIAGTATPVVHPAAPGPLGRTGLIVLWVLTATAAVIHLVWMDAPERLVGGTFLALGWVAALALPEVWIHAGPVAGSLMIAGGLLYTVGALSYHRRRPDPYPSVFGYHEVFHVYVAWAPRASIWPSPCSSGNTGPPQLREHQDHEHRGRAQLDDRAEHVAGHLPPSRRRAVQRSKAATARPATAAAAPRAAGRHPAQGQPGRYHRAQHYDHAGRPARGAGPPGHQGAEPGRPGRWRAGGRHHRHPAGPRGQHQPGRPRPASPGPAVAPARPAH